MAESENLPRVLIIDDDEVFRTRLCRAFAQRNWEARAAAGGEEALVLASKRLPDLALVDLRMPGQDGLELVEKLRAIGSSMSIIMLTGYGSIPTTICAMKRGADYYLSKPADVDQILAAYHRLQTPGDPVPNISVDAPSLARVEWEHMQRVITDSDGNISEAARKLGIHRRSLQRKLSKYPPAR
ncbi:MAG TPA: response regulator [Silvibacterium sp.]|nr:response regulator [Silvibacterium sp.]